MEVSPSVRQRMQRTQGRDNPFEKSVRSDLFKRGVRYRINYPIPSIRRVTYDIALPGWKTAIFLDGCFWHGCPNHPHSVKRNSDFWMEKIEQNRSRDARVDAHLADIGWIFLRFWEHERVAAIVETIIATLEKTSRSPNVGARPLKSDQRPA